MRSKLTVIALFAVLGISGYLYSFQRDQLLALWYSARGYKAAKTPEEAFDYFNKGLEARDYKPAAKYLGGDYAVQFRKAAEPAQKLGKAVDDFRSVMETSNIKSAEVDLVLDSLEPLPKKYQVKDIKKKNDDEAAAIITAEGKGRYLFAGGFQVYVTLKREKDAWTIHIPMNEITRREVEALIEKHKDLVNALNVVKNRMKTDATTKENVLNDLKEELRKAGKP